jgi:hypothetical protein
MKMKFVGLAMGVIAAVLTFGAPDSAFAQNGGDGLQPTNSLAGGGELKPRQPGRPDDPLSTTVTHTEATRLNRLRRRNGVVSNVESGPQLYENAQSAANRASLSCKVHDATLRGLNAEGVSVYEVACIEGGGYIISNTSPPQAADCVAIAGRATRAQAQDPNAAPGPVCTMPENQNIVGIVAAYAKAAGVDCSVDEGAWVGESTTGNAVYEVGCAGTGGYWVERVAGHWTATDCVKVMAQNASCGFTTPQERAFAVKTWLAASSASGCDVVDARYMGENANGAFYEAKCTTGGGYVARVDQARAVQQVYPCAEATGIGGGCRLAGRP